MNDPFRGRKKRNWLLVISPRQSHIFSKNIKNSNYRQRREREKGIGRKRRRESGRRRGRKRD